MAIQNDNTLVTKGDLKELYTDKIAPYLGGGINYYYSGGSEEGNKIFYGFYGSIVNLPTPASDGDTFYVLDPITKAKLGQYLYIINNWHLIEGYSYDKQHQTLTFSNLNFGKVDYKYAHGISQGINFEVSEAYYNFTYTSNPNNWKDATTSIEGYSCEWFVDNTNVWLVMGSSFDSYWSAQPSRAYKVVLSYSGQS